MIPLDMLVPELLLALGGAFLLGNLAAYVRLRPAWREARQGRHAGDPPISRLRVVVNMAVGLVITAVSIAALLRG